MDCWLLGVGTCQAWRGLKQLTASCRSPRFGAAYLRLSSAEFDFLFRVSQQNSDLSAIPRALRPPLWVVHRVFDVRRPSAGTVEAMKHLEVCHFGSWSSCKRRLEANEVNLCVWLRSWMWWFLALDEVCYFIILLPENALKTFSPTFVENVAYNTTWLCGDSALINKKAAYCLIRAFGCVGQKPETYQMSTACQRLVSWIVREGVTLLGTDSIPETATFCFTNPKNIANSALPFFLAMHSAQRSIA